MARLKKIFWTIYFLLFCRPYSLKQFKIYCLKIDGVSQSEWEEILEEIKANDSLRKWFRINTEPSKQ